MKEQKQATVAAITPKAGEQLLRRKFENMKLVDCFIELIKNARDYGAKFIDIVVGKDYVEVTDDGRGMDEAKRQKFCSTGISTDDSGKKTAKFGTGSKYMLYKANGVEVWTKTADDPGVVNFSLSTEDYQRQLFGQKSISPKVLPDSAWQFNSPTGARLRYDFSGTQEKHIKNVDHLVTELSQELPLVVMDSLLFNGKSLPAKEIKGGYRNMVREELVNEHLGMISIELYSLKGKKNNKGVMLSSTGMPEVPFAAFLSMLPSKVRNAIPDVYLNLADLSGVIFCKKLFDPYINEDRKSFQETIADSPLIPYFVILLVQKEEEVKAMLGVEQNRGNTSIEGLIDDLINRSAKAYGEAFSDGMRNNDDHTEPLNRGTLQILGASHEYEPGQKVKLTLKVDTDLDNSTSFEWSIAKSGLKDVRISDDQLQLTGVATKEFGFHTISAQSAKGFTAQTQYEIVAARKPYLSASVKKLKVGEDYKLVIFNADMVHGKVKWTIQKGPGKLEVIGKERKQATALFFATASGETTVIAEGMDVNGRPFRETCQLTTTEKQHRLLKILDYKFMIRQSNTAGQPPMFIIKGNGDPLVLEHDLHLNVDSAIWKKKEAQSNPGLAIYILAEEFARFYFEDVLGEELGSDDFTRRRFTEKTEEVLEAFL